MALMANSCPRKMPQKIRPQIFPMTIAYLALLNGWLILMRIMKPTADSSMVAVSYTHLDVYKRQIHSFMQKSSEPPMGLP